MEPQRGSDSAAASAGWRGGGGPLAGGGAAVNMNAAILARQRQRQALRQSQLQAQSQPQPQPQPQPRPLPPPQPLQTARPSDNGLVVIDQQPLRTATAMALHETPQTQAHATRVVTTAGVPLVGQRARGVAPHLHLHAASAPDRAQRGRRGRRRETTPTTVAATSGAEAETDSPRGVWRWAKSKVKQVWLGCICVRWNDPALSRWQVVITVGLPWLKRLFILFLIVFTLALCANVFAEPGQDESWLYWQPFRGALVFCAVIIGLVQLLAIGLIVWLNYQQANAGGVGVVVSSSVSAAQGGVILPNDSRSTALLSARPRRRRGCFEWSLVRKNLESIFIFLFFEWTVINVTTLFVSVSALGLPWFSNFATGFAVTFCSCLIQYFIFVRQYLKRKPVLQWSRRDSFIVIMPVTGFLLGAGFLYIVSIGNAPAKQTMSNWLAVTVVLGLFSLTVPPLALDQCIVKRYQRRAAKRARVQLQASTAHRLLASSGSDNNSGASSSNNNNINYNNNNHNNTVSMLASHNVFGTWAASSAVTSRKALALSIGPADTLVEQNIRKRCRELEVERDQLQSLMLVGMDLEDLQCLEGCTGLRRLYLSNNRISSLQGIDRICPGIECLHVDNNALSSALDLMPLRSLPRLSRLAVEGNLLCTAPGFELAMLVCLLPQASLINGLTVTPEARGRAAARHAGWLQDLRLAYQARQTTEALRTAAGGQLLAWHRLRLHFGAFSAPSQLRNRDLVAGGLALSDRGAELTTRLLLLADEYSRQRAVPPPVAVAAHRRAVAANPTMRRIAAVAALPFSLPSLQLQPSHAPQNALSRQARASEKLVFFASTALPVDPSVASLHPELVGYAPTNDALPPPHARLFPDLPITLRKVVVVPDFSTERPHKADQMSTTSDLHLSSEFPLTVLVNHDPELGYKPAHLPAVVELEREPLAATAWNASASLSPRPQPAHLEDIEESSC
ncbi:hypothetical protein CAOG_03652 [Capsaspora owczarzaki ATCC 30864]|uniref:Uncharacterized protein n=1 Tax=Capsaspora owczarzaki (strain ATCC 30864) TaxID=595528 RepID=A0A0D2WPS4_CAPO3|nr:hypothetical protein CAOG_03652 [Capsaspora owczarzaki ATCC 30864]KJE92743.1 hypothetical protein CAOG_003652 [Capsaspora owczarzaki ATCC 30864]|eukprot:XP_004363380.1 hypothetical protein CAOG_03652 [Capsaspora owczarzaki ATCC 30864]